MSEGINAQLWAGEFGVDYESRNTPTPDQAKRRQAFIHTVTRGIGRYLEIKEEEANLLEVGSGAGHTLMLLRKWTILRSLTGVDINPDLVARANLLPLGLTSVVGDAAHLPFAASEFNIVVTCGLLIHIPPALLATVYAELWRVCAGSGLLILAEYFSPIPREILYRGRAGVLWARDFGGEALAANPSAKVCDYWCTRSSLGGYDNLDVTVLKNGDTK